ncbi:sugar dehydratase [Candidatus Roizmanbacteria bacterium CG_4_9_14_0_2_um_filter_39_13]|uniref:Sugar dehydratase n=1 Tax=Candidatus Roizmanbacteria bacterium CG_4_9_14_0_2_um_filter_39_13 TaxID=1974839 RepID=A0A2M8EWD9_9BACT|nr:MAG: sugar dehydratase [Candidatus Roizmanbacteria bacterium CG_4_9_14_0_2_um_filter_39_13]
MESKSANLNRKNVLVTGGTGFVGSHLVEQLLRKGATVITTYKSLNPSSYFMTQELDKKTLMAPVDIVEYEKLFDLITKFEIDFIFHLAAQPLVETAYYNPRRTLDSNIRGTINVLESARQYPRIKGVIFASSDKAYGKSKLGEKYIESDPLRGDHPYEVSKSAADLIVSSYFKTYGVPVVTTRFGNIYGEGDLNYSRIIPGIMKSIIDNEDFEIRSDGTYVRDYLYVKDVVQGYLMLAEHIDEMKGEVFNFGSEDTMSVFEVIRVVETSIGKKVPFKILNQVKNEIPYQSLDYNKSRKQLNWEPQNSLLSIAKNILHWYQFRLR